MPGFLYIATIIIVSTLYAFTYLEILFIVYRIFYKESIDLPREFIYTFLCIPLLLFVISYFAQMLAPSDFRFDLFFASLAFFFSSIVLFSLGLLVKQMWEHKVREMNIKLLSVYSIWIIQGIYLIAVIVCFLMALVSLAHFFDPLEAVHLLSLF